VTVTVTVTVTGVMHCSHRHADVTNAASHALSSGMAHFALQCNKTKYACLLPAARQHNKHKLSTLMYKYQVCDAPSTR
jgi:hypothetical protein